MLFHWVGLAYPKTFKKPLTPIAT